MKFGILITFTVLFSLVVAGNHAVAKEAVPEVTVEGLQLIKDSNLALVYAEPGINLGQYSKVYLDDAYIAFKKNWQRDQNRHHPQKIKAGDMARMKAELSSLFREVFSRTLEEGGYELVTERAENVLLLKPAIINLDVVAPDTMDANPGHSFSETTGEMTLYLELYDSLTDDLIAKALDRKIDRQTGYFQWQNHVTNRAAANRILQVWANVLKEGLDEARSTGVP
jgi:Protein of unknown function (DUF3313)